MTLVREFNLYLTAGRSIPLVINVNQFDSGEEWHFTLFKEDGTQYIPSTGAIVGIKSDGLGIINSGTVVDGKVVIVETQQMTAAVGKATFELTIDSGTHGTANFHVLVEPKPGNNADLSDSDISLIQEALNAVSPLPTGGTVGQVLTKTAQGSAWSDAGTPTQAQVAEAVSDWADENITVTTGVVIDQSLSVQGAAADAKKTGDEISDLKSAIEQGGSGLTEDVKQALLAVFQKCIMLEDGDEAYNDLADALYPPIPTTSVTITPSSLSFVTTGGTQQLTATILPVDTTDSFAWASSDTSVATVDQTGLVTVVNFGTCMITCTSGSVTGSCSVVVAPASVTSISAVFTQESNVIYNTDSLNVLKQYLTVTANWSNGTTTTPTDYTLSGTLTVGTSTITVSYGGKSTTFNVTVTERIALHLFDFTQGLTDSVTGTVLTLGGDATRDSSGVHLNSTDSYVALGQIVRANADVTVEFEFGEISKNFSNRHGRLLMWSDSGGVIWRNASPWVFQVYAGSWKTFNDSITVAQLSDAVVKFKIGAKHSASDPKSDLQIYINGVLEYTAGSAFNTSSALSLWLGSAGGQSFNDATIKSVKVFAGVN